MNNDKQQLNTVLFIDRHNLEDLAKLNKLVREGWDIVHLNPNSDEKSISKDTKIVLTRFL